MSTDMERVPGFLFFDHVAISVKPGELESNVKAYEAMLGFLRKYMPPPPGLAH